MKIAIFGIQGQLGRDLELELSGHDVIGFPIEQVDIRSEDAVLRSVVDAAPDWVLNSAAMTHVEKCETEKELAYAVNATGALHVARAANEYGAHIVHFSTDYVFDGSKEGPYIETDQPRPINVYGDTKLAGERFVADACRHHYIIRTSGLYGMHECWGKGTNFVETMMKLSRDNTELKIVSDEVLTPTFTEDLSRQVRRMIEEKPDWGVYHATNEGQCSWFDFATEIFRLAHIPIALEGITSSQWGALAKRPANSVLENAALKAAGINVFPDWRDALARYMAKRSERLD